MAQRQEEFERADVPIDAVGDILVVEIPGDTVVGVDIDATAQAGFELDRSTTGEAADRLGVGATYPNATSVSDTFRLSDRHLHVRVATAAAAGATADITVQVGR